MYVEGNERQLCSEIAISAFRKEPKVKKYKKCRGISKKRKLKEERRKAAKEKSAQRIVIEDTELLSKEQLKKISKNPLNNIRASGKRKQKILKRLRHSQKEKSQMDVEVEEAAPKSKKKRSKDKDVVMESDPETSGDEEMA